MPVLDDKVQAVKDKRELLKDDPYYDQVLASQLPPNYKANGNYSSAYFVQPQDMHPFNLDPFVSSLWELCCGSLAQTKVGYYETLSPYLADSITKQKFDNKVIYRVTLDPNLKWGELELQLEDIHEVEEELVTVKSVCSRDFQLFVQLLHNRHLKMPKIVALRKKYQGLESIHVIDDTTFEVVWKLDEHEPFDIDFLTAQLRPLPAHIYLSDQKGDLLFEEDQLGGIEFARHFEHHWSKKYLFSCGPIGCFLK